MKKETNFFKTILLELQNIDPEFPIQYAICLSEIALDEGLSMSDLAKKTGMPLSTVSRIASALSKNKPRGRSYNFIQIKISPIEKRKKQIFLTQNGRNTLRNITEKIAHFRK